MDTHSVDVCIVGGGPAGMVLGNLLAAQGVSTLVLEQHHDFSREYRGEVLMPRFTQQIKQINFTKWLEKVPRREIDRVELYIKEKRAFTVNIAEVVPEVPAALWIPQTLLLNGLHEEAKKHPKFDLWFGASAKGLLKKGQVVEGVVTSRDGTPIEVRARVVVGADGRFSAVRKMAGFEFEYDDHRFDILWFTIPQPAGYDNTVRAMISPSGSYLLLPKYPEAIQVGVLVRPNEFAEMRKAGIEETRKKLLGAHPMFKDFALSLKDFSAFHPLQAYLHMTRGWAKDGVLLIGDSAHCCSPAGAIGVSVAVGSAIVAADQISKLLKSEKGVLSQSALSQVEKLRDKDVRHVHSVQRRLFGGRALGFVPISLILPTLLFLASRIGIIGRTMRSLVTQQEKLPVSLRYPD